MERMNLRATAGKKMLQSGYYTLKLTSGEDNSPVLVLCGENGELPLKMAGIYEQAFRAQLDGKA